MLALNTVRTSLCSGVMDGLHCQLEPIIQEGSKNGDCLSAWLVGMSLGGCPDYVNCVWMTQPVEGVISDCKNGASELSTGMHAFICSLLLTVEVSSCL